MGVGATLGILIIGLASFVVTGQYSTGAAIAEVRRDVADLRERMARLEGLFEGFTKRPDGSPEEGSGAGQKPCGWFIPLLEKGLGREPPEFSPRACGGFPYMAGHGDSELGRNVVA